VTHPFIRNEETVAKRQNDKDNSSISYVLSTMGLSKASKWISRKIKHPQS